MLWACVVLGAIALVVCVVFGALCYRWRARARTHQKRMQLAQAMSGLPMSNRGVTNEWDITTVPVQHNAHTSNSHQNSRFQPLDELAV